MSFLLLAILASANPAVQPAPAPAAPPPATAPAAKPKKPKLICKVSDDDTGSRMVKHTCLTQEEWDARVQGRTVDDLQTLPTQH
jgi:hypothetical protein